MYKVVTVGGTFAYLHRGHKTILRKAFAVSEKVVVGVTCQKFPLRGKHLGGQTSDAFAQKARNGRLMKRSAFHAGFVGRRREVERFLKQERLMERVEVVKIEDIFGPLKEVKSYKGDMGIEAMVVTEETKGNAEKINKWRKENNLAELDIVEVEMELAEDGKPISSRRIRDGEINREGVVYRRNKLWGKLPREMREELRKPLGKIIRGGNWEMGSEIAEVRSGIDGIERSKILTSYFSRPIVTIGDVSTKRLIEAGIKPELVVFDLKVRRKKIFAAPEEIGVGKQYKIVRLKNPAGGVSSELWNFFKETPFKFERSLLLRLGRLGVWIDGEEDLAALPAVLFAPLGAVVVYGQPPQRSSLSQRRSSLSQSKRVDLVNGGLVVVEITEEKKEKVFSILQRFEK